MKTSQDRVTSASAATLRGQAWQPEAKGKEAVIPEVAVKRPRDDEETGEKGKGKGKGKMSVKELTNLKRFKGPSGLDHNGKVWKPEATSDKRVWRASSPSKPFCLMSPAASRLSYWRFPMAKAFHSSTDQRRRPCQIS